jgi:hypothetical protein
MNEGLTHSAPLPGPRSLARGGANREPRWGDQRSPRTQGATIHRFTGLEESGG